MAFVFASVFTDNFNRANETPLSTNGWSDNRNAGGTLDLLSNSVVFTTVLLGAHFINSATLDNDQYGEVAVTVNGTGTGPGFGVQIRGVTGAGNENKYIAIANTDTVTIFRYESATFNLLGTRSVTWVNGDRFAFGAIGSDLYAFQNRVQLGASINDTIFTTGRSGLIGSSTVVSASGDDFESGNFSISASAGGFGKFMAGSRNVRIAT